uniref:Uncharacterized protein n=1 Tax=Cannabis sativa TaxID=3483 RepID=A0A803Q0T8_CANSA
MWARGMKESKRHEGSAMRMAGHDGISGERKWWRSGELNEVKWVPWLRRDGVVEVTLVGKWVKRDGMGRDGVLDEKKGTKGGWNLGKTEVD